MERKLLRRRQIRLGPNKIRFWGILQPLLDGFKLIIKENLKISKSFFVLYFFRPLILWFSTFLLWTISNIFIFWFDTNWSFLFILCCLGLSVYGSLLAGWRSRRKYRSLGRIRASAQSISYEVILSLIFFLPSISYQTFNLINLFNSKKIIFFFLFTPVIILWILCSWAECNRAPFDFAEGESELVSGFNTEYSRVLFSILFISEYGSIIFFSWVTSLIWFYFYNFFYIFISLIFLCILRRASFPRFKYNELIELAWKILLPLIILILITPFLIFLL